MKELVDSLCEEFNDLIDHIISGKPSYEISMKHRIHLIRGKLYELEKKFDEMEDNNVGRHD